MKLLIIANPKIYENRRFTAEGRKLGHSVTVRKIRDVVFDLRRSSARILIAGKRLERAYDAVYLRHFPPSMISEMLLIAEWAARHGLFVFEPSLARGWYVRSKMYDYWKLKDRGLPVPKGFQIMRLAQAGVYLKSLSLPLVAKGIHGGRGKYVYLVHSRKDLKEYLSDDLVGFFTFQEYLRIDAEYRVIVIGGKAIGAMRKHRAEGDFRHNVALGGSGEKAKIPAAWNRISERAAKALGFGIAGVDLAIVKGKPYLLEVNRMPAFGEFESATGTNVAKRFIEYVAQNRNRRAAKRR